ncbi:MAG: FKBP-type peptidyl-prolyl cis-trans isomerase [Bacteroidetes bacterium]|nr:FKBP-type peptidyl-prolyl cis-trans isomerase [Bacteroidota bacterium]
MKKLFFISCVVIAAASVNGQTKPAARAAAKSTAKPATARPVLKNMVDSASYAIGISEAKFMKQQGISKINSAMVAKAIEDVMNNKEVVLNDQQCNSAVMSYINTIQMEKSKGTIEAGEKFLAENKKRPEVKTTSSGLQYEVIKEGTGVRPTPEDSVTCHYAGSFIDGNEFESSYKRGEPITFALRGVIPGWTEGLQHMTVGSKYKFYIPYRLAYGPQDYNSIPGGSTLIFEVELLDVKKKNP